MGDQKEVKTPLKQLNLSIFFLILMKCRQLWRNILHRSKESLSGKCNKLGKI